ncbi:uncharacterized protein LOC135392170 [Ornithodoros turicata]|uniref:uncharacterized protein LOC135392170 n=1 Tax=Ornithodoros turicata TaxID=34597 RepID=UPI00313944A6
MEKDSSKRSSPESELFRAKFEKLHRRALAGDIPEEEIVKCLKEELSKVVPPRRFRLSLWLKCFIIIAAFAMSYDSLEDVPCLLEPSAVFMEMTRPIADCAFCKVDGFFESENMTRELFLEIGYSDRPIILRGAAKNWKAMKTFNFSFFKAAYTTASSSLKTNDEYCQFFQYKCNFETLEDFFNMPDSPDAGTWYVGWSNCDHRVAQALREHYTRPAFLPEDSEASIIDWIFMGYSGNGATMHLDYVLRPSWQAQISGRKSWHLVPPPECEDVCRSLSITAEPGDMVMINTNKWYHGTWVEPGEISITIGSEYD